MVFEVLLQKIHEIHCVSHIHHVHLYLIKRETDGRW
jgi:hypothetical protein